MIDPVEIVNLELVKILEKLNRMARPFWNFGNDDAGDDVIANGIGFYEIQENS
jgi:hypothetical protein